MALDQAWVALERKQSESSPDCMHISSSSATVDHALQAYAAFAKQPEAMQALITAQVLPALQQSRQASRMQPCLWPIPTTCSAILKDSVHAPGMADGAVVESLCAHSLSQAAQHAPPLGQQQHAWVAAALPVSPPGQVMEQGNAHCCASCIMVAAEQEIRPYVKFEADVILPAQCTL